MPKVYIVGPDSSITQMFIKNGWDVVRDPDDADYLQFTGGSDVDPMLYQEPKHQTTYSDPERDSRESHLFRTYEHEKSMLGICRGGQFLNVMNGGAMWQNVDNHAIRGTHKAFDKISGEWWDVTSTHHQMMYPDNTGEVLVTAGLTSFREDGWNKYNSTDKEDRDTEVVFYPDGKSLCFQPHPEYVGIKDPCQRLYFQIIKHVFGD